MRHASRCSVAGTGTNAVASAAEELDTLDRLRDAMTLPDWVAEDPEAHLLPAVVEACRVVCLVVQRA